MGWLSTLFNVGKNLLGGAGQVIGQGAKAVAGAGSRVGQSMQGFDWGNLFGGKSAAASPSTSPIRIPFAQGNQSSARLGPMTSPISTNTGFNSTETEGKKKNWWDDLFPGGTAQGVAGLALPAIGNMFGPKSPEIPKFSELDSVKALQGFRPGNSVSPQYQEMIQKNTAQLREQKKRELDALYRNARPGTDYLTDTNYQRDLALLDKGIQDNMGDQLTRAEATFSQQEQDRLSEIAQMDIYSIMAQTGLDAQEANDFKEMFSNVGNMFLTNATRKPNQFDISSLFGS